MTFLDCKVKLKFPCPEAEIGFSKNSCLKIDPSVRERLRKKYLETETPSREEIAKKLKKDKSLGRRFGNVTVGEFELGLMAISSIFDYEDALCKEAYKLWLAGKIKPDSIKLFNNPEVRRKLDELGIEYKETVSPFWIEIKPKYINKFKKYIVGTLPRIKKS
jgi:hypothetical protein